MILVPALVAAALVVAPGCDVTDATLDWGFKESFRSYISGTIANGEWTTADGATYETPSFEWTGGTGRYDPETGEGYIEFTGSVRFTGHDGLLDTTIANPTLLLRGDEDGLLLLDVSGATMEGDVVDQTEVPFVALPDLAVIGGDAVRTVDVAAALTADGAAAFPNYEAGEAFDPVTATVTVGKLCAANYEGGDAIDKTGGFSPLAFGLIVFGALAAAAAAVALFVVTRRRRRA